MRPRTRNVLWLCLVALCPASALAAPLSLSGGVLTLDLGAVPPGSFAQAPDPVTVSVSTGGGFALPGGLFAGSTVLTPFSTLPTITGSPISVISTVSVFVSNQPGSFAPAGGPDGGFGGVLPLSGQVVVQVLSGLVNLEIPLEAVGAGGTVTAGVGALALTVTGSGWTTGAVSITGITTETPGTAVVNTVTFAGSDARTAGFRGALLLVTPVRVLTNAAGNLPMLVGLELHFAPEPAALGTLVLAAFCAALGWRRLRR